MNDSMVEYAGGPGTASAADPNGTVTFTFDSLHDLGLQDSVSKSKPRPTDPAQIVSAHGAGGLNFDAGSQEQMGQIEQVSFIIASPGVAQSLVFASVSEPGPMATDTADKSEDLDLAPYLHAGRMSITATVSYKAPVPSPTLNVEGNVAIEVQLSVW